MGKDFSTDFADESWEKKLNFCIEIKENLAFVRTHIHNQLRNRTYFKSMFLVT